YEDSLLDAAMSCDISDNIYVCGIVQKREPGNHYYFATIKYAPDGTQQWVNIYDTYHWGEWYVSIRTIDSSGVYVVATIQGLQSRDILVLKYNSDGILLWERLYDNPENSNDNTVNALIDYSGNLVICGVTYKQASSMDYLVLKYNSDGTLLWSADYGNPGFYEDQLMASCIDEQNNIYVTGKSNTLYSMNDYLTVKYDSNGIRQWVQSYNRADGDDIAYGIAADTYGYLYITGSSQSVPGDNTSNDIVTIRIPASGIKSRKVAVYDGAESGNDIGKQVIVSSTDKIDVLGTVFMNGNVSNYLLAQYDTGMTAQWVHAEPGLSMYSDFKSPLIVSDSDGNVYLSGNVSSKTTSYFVTQKYTEAGDKEWETFYRKLYKMQDVSLELDLSENRNIYVNGFSTGAGTSMDFVTIKYSQCPVTAELRSSAAYTFPEETVSGTIKTTVGSCCISVVPNPFQRKTAISYQLDAPAYVAADVFTITGQKIQTLVNEAQQEGAYRYEFNAEKQGYSVGVYILKINVNGEVKIFRLVQAE
ncbi:MAG: SBBP repeat-containing protein, partial [Bacteroidetes bacterium]|nr:SBBP repeat-containing protein [Bacteroidota bacterium]